MKVLFFSTLCVIGLGYFSFFSKSEYSEPLAIIATIGLWIGVLLKKD